MIWLWLRRHPRLVDAALVALIIGLTIPVAVRRPDTAAAILLGIAAAVPVLWRRRFPVGVLVAVSIVAVVTAGSGVVLLPLAPALALYTVAATSEPRTARLAGLGAIVAIGAAAALGGTALSDATISRVVFMIAGWLLGDSVRSRRAYVQEIEEKADRLERERESEARRAVSEEQARIARELHDVVAHALSVIVVQAAAADDVFETDPRRARQPIRAIEAAARAALGDLRRVLGVVRDGADYEPQPSLLRLDRLIDQVRATGLDVALTIEGTPRELPASVDLSAYRIVQEALTNTLRHAGAEHALVRVRYGDELDLEITDDGRPHANGSSVAGGNGLVGMRERAAMLGGSVSAGPAANGGYSVSARIPI